MSNIVFIDFETYHDSLSGYDLRAMSMTEYINDPRFKVFGCGVQVNDSEPTWLSEEDVGQFFNLYDWSQTIIVAHNVKFDGAILSWKYGIKPLEWRDTKSMAMAVYGASVPSFSLKALSDRLGLVSKGVMKTNGLQSLTEVQEAELAEYCLTDVKICAELYNRLAPQIPESQWPIMDWTIRAFVEPKLQVNLEAVKQVQENIKKHKVQALEQCGVDLKVLSSNQQFAEYLKHQGYTAPMKKNPKGKLIPALALGDPEFVAMTQSKDEKLKQICLARKEVKKTMEIKRAEKLQAVGKAYPFDVIFSGATQTHRFSGGNGAGGNPQNFPRESELRRCIEAPEGSQLIVGDFKNIEMRILTFLSRESKLIKAIRENVDVYAEFAAEIYNIPIHVITKAQRQYGKCSILGLGYNMGPKKFYKTCLLLGLDVPEGLAKSTVYLYRDTYPAIPNFWKICDVVIQMMADGQKGFFPGVPFLKVKKEAIILPSGLEIKFPNLRKEDGEWIFDKYKSQVTKIDKVKLYGGKLTENICQALAGEVCKESIQRLLDEGLSPQGAVHDELLLVAEKDELALVDMKHAMTDPIKWWPELVLDVDLGVGQNWYEAKHPKEAANA